VVFQLQWFNYWDTGAGSLNLEEEKEIEAKNEIMIIGEYKYEWQCICEHRRIFLLPKKRQQPRAETEKF